MLSIHRKTDEISGQEIWEYRKIEAFMGYDDCRAVNTPLFEFQAGQTYDFLEKGVSSRFVRELLSH